MNQIFIIGAALLSSLIWAILLARGIDYKITEGIKKKLDQVDPSHVARNNSPIKLFLRWVTYISLDLVRWPWLFLETLLFILNKLLFRLGNVSYFYYMRQAIPMFRHEKIRLFSLISSYILIATYIRIALGEMSHDLMEDEDFISAVEFAGTQNQAKIEIVHGPRVDLKTKKIYDLEKRGLVELYRSPVYDINHYMLITTKDGDHIVVDEAVHCETLWDLEEGDPIIESLTRNIYIYKGKNRLKQFHKREYERRKELAVPESDHPGIHEPQNYSSRYLLWIAFKNNFLLGRIIQPLAILFDIPLKILFSSK